MYNKIHRNNRIWDRKQEIYREKSKVLGYSLIITEEERILNGFK